MATTADTAVVRWQGTSLRTPLVWYVLHAATGYAVECCQSADAGWALGYALGTEDVRAGRNSDSWECVPGVVLPDGTHCVLGYRDRLEVVEWL